MKKIIFILTAGFMLALGGCASQSTLEKRTMDESAYPSQTYSASSKKVVEATVQAINTLGYSLKNVTEKNDITEVYFSKPMSAFSWGEVGRIDIRSLGETQTKVILSTEKRYQVQITGTKQSEFAQQIFSSLAAQLK